jgi:hypothetical protein
MVAYSSQKFCQSLRILKVSLTMKPMIDNKRAKCFVKIEALEVEQDLSKRNAVF